MHRLRTALRLAIATIAVAAAAPVGLYLVLLAINWRDRPPSDTALDFAAAHRALPNVTDRDNAYVYLLGFAARRDEDPAAIGTARAGWLRSTVNSAPPTDDPHPVSWLDAIQEPPALTALLTQCELRDAACVAALDGRGPAVTAGLADEAWKIERYRRLLAYHAWRDVASANPGTVEDNPLPAVLTAHRLFLIDTWLVAAAGDAAAVRERLDADLALWRLALAETDSLFSKSLAATYIREHFQWGNLILRRLPPAARGPAVPAGWRVPFTPSERSLRRAFVGEWSRVDALLRASKSRPELLGGPDGGKPPSAAERFDSLWWRPLLQPQAAANREAALLAELDVLFDSPYAEIPAARDRARTLDASSGTWLDWTYDPIGRAMLAPQRGAFADYGAKISDLEGLRRAALLAAELRARDVAPDAVAAAAERDALRNPYSGAAFAWLEDRAAIGFTGLARGPAARITLLY